MSLATLSIDLVAHLAKFEGDMGKAARATEKASQQITSSLGAVKSVLGGLAAGVSIGGIISIAKASIDSVDALNDLRDATGASIENISALEDTAARTGTSMDTVGTSLVKFNAALKDAKPGSDAEAAFKKLGLSVKELQALDPAEALLKTATALSGFADDGDKARLTQELFGKSLREVAPFLKDLADKGKLVATVTTEQAQAAEEFNKQLYSLQKNSQDAARALTGELVPAMAKLLGNFAEMRNAGLLGTVIKDAAFDMVGLGLLTKDAGADINSLIKTRDALMARGNKSGFTDGLRKDISEINDLLAISRIRQKSMIDQGKEYSDQVSRKLGSKPSIGTIPDKKKTGPDPDADYKRYLENLDKEIEKSLELTKLEQLLVDINSGRLTVTPWQEEELILRAKIIDVSKAEADAAKYAEKAMADARKSSEQYLAGLSKEAASMDETNRKMAEHIQEIGLTTVQLDALTLARMDAAIAAQEQARSELNLQNSSEAEIEAMDRKIALLKEQRALTAKGQVAQAGADSKDKADRASKDFADTLHNDLKGAFSTAFRDSSGEPLQAFGEAIANIVYTRAATALAESLIQSAGGTGATSFLGSLFSFDGGGFTGSGARAGGLDGKGGFLSVMHPQETVLDHTRNQAISSGGNTVSVQIIEAPGKGGQTSRSSDGGTDVLTVFVEQVKASIASDISRGSGAVPGAMSSTYGLNRVAGAY